MTTLAGHLRTTGAVNRLRRVFEQIAAPLPHDEWTLFAMQVSGRQLDPKEVLVRTARPLDYHYWLDDGLLSASATSPAGVEVTTDIISQGDFFISYAAVDREEPPRVTVSAEIPSFCLAISHALLSSVLQRDQSWNQIYRYIAEQTAIRHEQHLLDVLTEDGPTRWKRFLLDHAAIADKIAPGKLASYLGLSERDLLQLHLSAVNAKSD